MKSRQLIAGLCVVGCLVVLVGVGVWRSRLSRPTPPPFTASLERGEVVPVAEYRFSGPYTHDNLTVFLIHGRATLPGKNYLTLQEALEKDLVVVHETGSVNQLSIENRSRDHEVFVQSGDIVKGGQQDRTLPYDFIASPGTGVQPIDSYCVEQGRWAERKGEKVALFSSSSFNLSGHGLARAAYSAKEHRGQSAVWKNVAQMQERLAAKLGESVRSEVSATSLQLSLENPRLQEAIAPYLAAVSPAPDAHPDVIGYAVALNGTVMSADVYASERLFKKLWPKLLQANAIEAVAESEPGKATGPVTEQDVKSFLTAAEGGKPADEAVTGQVYVMTVEGEKQILFDTCDRARENLVIHRSVLAR
jgi:hypothetical protein